MKVIARWKTNRTDAEVAELFTNLLGLGVIVFIITLFLLAMGLVEN